MRVLFTSLISFALTGCDKVGEWQHPELAACESFISGGLRSPSTYKRINVEYDRPQMNSASNTKNVHIEYDAANAYGTPVRASQLCEFKTDSSGKFVPEPESAASSAAISRDFARALGDDEWSKCCVSPARRKDESNSENASDAAEAAAAAAAAEAEAIAAEVEKKLN